MSEHQDHHHELPNDDLAQLPYHSSRSNVNSPHENNVNPPTQTLDGFRGSFDTLGMLSSPYGHLENAGTLMNFQHTFQPAEYPSQQHVPAFSGGYISRMHAPTSFYSPQYVEQPWVEEISHSHTSIDAPTFEWAPPDSNSYSWLVNAAFTNPGEQLGYEHTATMLPALQHSPSDNPAIDPLFAHFLPEKTPQISPQHSGSINSVPVAVKVKSEKLNKDITAVLYKKSNPNSDRTSRISKMKKAEKTDNNKTKQEACWRCKRYRKACIGQDVCKECSTAGFRVWPSAIGCRRGAMEGFVEKIMPSHSISVLRELHAGVSRTSNWRKALYPLDQGPQSPNITTQVDRWDLLKVKVQSTMVFGSDFSALVDIISTYEKARGTEILIWTQAILLLSSTCDFYHFFVASSSTEIQLPNLINATIKLRKALLRSWDMFLKLSLSGRRENWFPAFLTVVLGICSMVILLDAVPSMPGPTRKGIWSDIEAIVKDLRIRQHMMTLDLLRIGAKGVNPLKLDCWVTEEEEDADGSTVLRRNAKGMALLGHDSAAFDAFIALRQWHLNNKAAMLEGNDMWDSVPFTLTHIQGIASLSRVFEF